MSELTDHARASVSSVADGEWEVDTVYEHGAPRSYRVTNCERFRELRNDIGTGTDKSLAEFIAGSRELILALAARVDELECDGDHEDGTVGDMISTLVQYPLDHRIVLSSDAEGNDYSPWHSYAERVYVPEYTWSGAVYATKQQVAEDDDYTEDDLPPEGEEAFPAVVLYPRR
jgi:hypothetical protein